MFQTSHVARLCAKRKSQMKEIAGVAIEEADGPQMLLGLSRVHRTGTKFPVQRPSERYR